MTAAREEYLRKGRAIRRQIVEILRASGRGHVGAAFSIVETLLVLYDRILKYDPKDPKSPGRDRFILSKGHGCLALYCILAEKGFFPREELLKVSLPGGILGGHPDHRLIPGIEASTGSLGHGLAVGVGMALAARMDRSPHRVFVLLGDGECDEGSVWESALHAAKHGLDGLVAIVDYNKMQSYDRVAKIAGLEPFADKWRAFGFETREVDMDRPEELERTLRQLPFAKGRPGCVITHTVKGKGVSFVENNPSWHHKNKLTDEEVKGLLKELED